MTSAPVTMHGDWEDNFDDPLHPIPSLTALDVHGIKKGGGSDLVIVIAKPLESDERSQKRLLDKISIYLNFLKSPEYTLTCGAPDPENTFIVVRLPRESDPAIFDLLARCGPWIEKGNAALKVELRSAEHSPN